MSDNKFVIQALFSELVRRGSVSRSFINQEYGIRSATLIAVVNRLKKRGLLYEPERKSFYTGRRASNLYIKPKAASFIGIELTPANIFAVRINAGGEVERRLQEEIKQNFSCERICSLLIKTYKNLLPHGEAALVAFADPGTIDISSGKTLQAVNLPAWEKVNVKKLFRDNSADHNPLCIPETLAHTYAEYLHCAPDFPKSLFHARFSEGIGSGFINNGELLIGNRCASMELGHLVLLPTGRRCRCGNRGCLEAMAGGAALKQMMQELVESGVNSKLDMENFSLEKFVEAALENDRAAKVLAEETCERIGPVMAMVSTLLNPQIIVLSGELTGLGNMLSNAIERAISLKCLNNNEKAIKIKISTLDRFSGARAAALLRRNIFLEEELKLDRLSVPSLSAGLP